MRRGLIPIVLLLGACGVPTSDGASTADASQVPYGLLDAVQTTTTTLPELAREEVLVWFVHDDGIQPVRREVAAPSSIRRMLAAVVDGPTPDEAALGLRSAVPEDGVAGVELRMGVATIDLRTEFAASTPREQLLALAQLVYTAMEAPAVAVVTFTLNEQSIDVPRGDGSISDGPVTRLDYAGLRVDAKE